MKFRYLGKSNPVCLIKGKVYECLGEENGEYRIVDEEGYDDTQDLQGYLYPKTFFEVINET